VKALGVTLGLTALVGGALFGRLAAPPEIATGPSAVEARISQPVMAEQETQASSATRWVPVDVSPAAIERDAAALLAQATRQRDPAAAAHELLPRYDFDGPSDACADGSTTTCPRGAPANLRADPVPPAAPQVESTEPGRPPTAVFAVTPDLVAVSVAHREGERVTVLPNTISGDEPECDPVVTGDDRFAHPLPPIEATIDPAAIEEAGWDPVFSSRTTVAFDINEGVSIFLCAQVIPRESPEPNYRAQAIVQTADRLVPTVLLSSVTGLALPGWTVEGYLAGGEPCGSVRVPTVRTFTAVAIDFPAPLALCEARDALGVSPPGRGVLPFSRGDSSTLTVAHAYSNQPAEYTSLDLGAAALCTGSCTAPMSARYRVWGSHGTAVVIVSWSQGNTNGVAETAVGVVRDAAGGEAPDDATSPRIPRAPVVQRDVVLAINYRVNTDIYSVGASRIAAYLTVRAGGVAVVGPRAGQCFGDQTGFDGAAGALVAVADVIHVSGSVQTVSLVPDTMGCVPDWPTSPLAITFAADIPLQDLIDHPEGVVLRVDQPLGADPSVRATASAIVRISLG
jgi:hypothetical protein